MNNVPLSFSYALAACEGDIERKTCEWVEARLRLYEGSLYEVVPHQIAKELGVKDDKDLASILSALDILSLGSIGVLKRRYEWYESGGQEILAMPKFVDGYEVAEALRTGAMYSPVTGELVRDFAKHIHLVYQTRLKKE